jgi:hypothetical protein
MTRGNNMANHYFSKKLFLSKVVPSIQAKLPSDYEMEECVRDEADYVNNINGIYFLVDASGILYIGQTGNLMVRIHRHRKTFGHGFKVAFIACPSNLLDAAEAYYIVTLRPKYNKTIGNITADFNVDELATFIGDAIPETAEFSFEGYN